MKDGADVQTSTAKPCRPVARDRAAVEAISFINEALL
jgi:hypothetical protein